MEASPLQEQEFIQRSREEIAKRNGKTPEQLYEEREKRLVDTIALKEADRVPVVFRPGYFVLKYAGLTESVAFYQPRVHKQAVMRALLDFEPDVYQSAGNANSGLALEALDAKQYRWPGGTLPPDITPQFIDMETMKADEYDLFMTDPTDFVLRYYLPRIYGTLEPLSELPSLGQSLIGSASPVVSLAPVLIKPDFQKMAQTLLEASHGQAEFHSFEKDIRELGFPLGWRPSAGTFGPVEPFDLFASYLRGLSGVMSDMFRQPEKLLAACERVLEWRLARAVPAVPNKKGYPERVQIGSFHFCSDRFLSKKQFETFVWPTYKKTLLAAIDMGYIAVPLGEGKCDDRVEYFLELPKGKVWFRFTDVDMARAKDILRGHTCIGGNVPASLLQVGSTQEVEEYCKKLIKVCGKGGGFILGCSSGSDEAKPANIKAMIDSAKKYGRYD